MSRNQNSKHSNSHSTGGPNSGSGSRLFQNLKRLANPSNNGSLSSSNPSNQITTDMISSPKTINTHLPRSHSLSTSPTRKQSHDSIDSTSMSNSSSTELKQPLNKKTSLNTQNLLQYMSNNSKTSPDFDSNHRRTQSVQSSKYSYSRRSSSQLSTIDMDKLYREQTNQSSSASILSQGSFANLSRFITSDGKLNLEMPSDPYEVETLFEDIMLKRNILQNLPPLKQRELMSYDIKKKWLIVKQDLRNEIKRMKSKSIVKPSSDTLTNTTNSITNSAILISPKSSIYPTENPNITKLPKKKSISGTSNPELYQQSERNISTSSVASDKTNRPPIYYVKKILSEQLSIDEANDLWVTLRTEQLDWVDAFLEHQGHIAMANSLMNTLYKTQLTKHLSSALLDKENSFFKCFKVLIMLKQGIIEFTKHSIMSDTVSRGLFSTRLSTKKMATEIYVFILQKKNMARFEIVLQSLDQNFKIGQNFHMTNYFRKFPQYFSHLTIDSQLKVIQAWRFAVEQILDGRGKMGSLVGASDEYKNSGGENSILEYCHWTMILINSICMGSENIQQRMHLRTKLENSGFLRVISRFKLFDYDKIMEEIESYENNKLDDFNTVLESNNNNNDVDLQDPISLLGNLWDACKGTDNERILVSLVQHIFLSSSRIIEKKNDPTQLSKQLKLMDSLITNIGASTTDEESTMNMAIQRLYDSMQTDEVARRAILESRTLTKKLEEVQAEKDTLSEKLSNAENGLVGRLENDLHERDRILSKNQRVTQQLQNELEELKKKHLLEKHEREVELRKMLTILNSRPETEMKKHHNSDKSVPGSKVADEFYLEKQKTIQKALQDGLIRTNKDFTSDSKKFGMTVQPNKRLKYLRSQMEDLENEARQLEMTNFTEYKKKNLEPPIKLKKKSKKMKPKSKLPSPAKKKENEAKIKKLNELRLALGQIQSESNDISKFNVEERVNEMFSEKKLKALQRLKELETKYKDFGVNFNVDEILGPSNISNDNSDIEGKSRHYSSLDPKMYESQLNAINKLTEELMNMQDITEDENVEKNMDDSSSISNSSTSSSSESSFVSETNNEIDSQNSERSIGAVNGSFLAALTQKYGMGAREPSSSTTDNERSFLNRVRKSSIPAPFLQELSQKVNIATTLDNNPTNNAANDIEDETDLETSKNYNKTLELGEESSEESSSRDERLVSENDKTLVKEETEPVSKAVPPPPPPPPPANLFNLENTKSDTDGATITAPPPPPPPPPFPTSSSTSISSMTPPPPPPPPQAPPMPSADSLKKDMSSPLLTQSPSLFENYPRPQKKLKQLHWEKIEPADNSIWNVGKAERFADDLYEKGVLSKLEMAFAAREIKSLASKKKEDLNKISFLSRDISQQFGINLHMYSSLPIDELVAKILKCDREFLSSPNVIEFLSKSEIIEVSTNLARNYAPYITEWEGVKSIEDAKAPEKDPNELQRADQIYLQLMVNLQSYWGSRMRALTVITSFEKDYNGLLTKLRKIDKAVSSLKGSENLRNVFNVILAVGNYMNDTSKQAQGFKLATLQRLTFIKDATNSMTFLNYVEKIVRINYPSFNDFLKELEPLFDVVKISIDQLVKDCNSFTQSIINVERSVEIGNLSDSSKFHPSDRVLAKVLPVLQESRKKADLLDDELKLTMMEFTGLIQIYGEDPGDKFAKNSFFQKFVDFISEYKKAQIQNINSEEEEKLYEKHKKMVEDQQRRQQEEDDKRRGKANMDSGTNENDEVGEDEEDRRDVMDKLLEQLKNAGPKKSDPTSARKRALIRKNYLGENNEIVDTTQDLETDEESLVYSPDAKSFIQTPLAVRSPSSKISISPNKHFRLKSVDSVVEEEDAEIQDRATTLLMELRGASSSSPKNNSSLDQHKEKLRARRKRSSRGSESSNILKFFDTREDTIPEVAETNEIVETNETKIDGKNEKQTNETDDIEDATKDDQDNRASEMDTKPNEA